MSYIIDLFKLSFANPYEAGLRLLALQPSKNTSLSAFAVTIILAAIMIFIFNGLGLVVLFPGMPPLSPIFVVIVIGIGNILLVACILFSSRIFQANGSFFDGIFLFAWMQILQIFLQVLQLGISIFSQELAGIVGLFGTGLLFWVLFGLINSWLDLGSNWKAAFCFLLGLIVMSICGSIFLISVGFSPV